MRKRKNPEPYTEAEIGRSQNLIEAVIGSDPELEALQAENVRLERELEEGRLTPAEREFIKRICKEQIPYYEALVRYPKGTQVTRDKLKMLLGLLAKVSTTL